MWQYNYTDELCHAGVKGMKWGVRKANKTSKSKQLSSKKQKTKKNQNQNPEARKKRIKRAAKIGAGIAVGTLATIGTIKVAKLAWDNRVITGASLINRI